MYILRHLYRGQRGLMVLWYVPRRGLSISFSIIRSILLYTLGTFIVRTSRQPAYIRVLVLLAAAEIAYVRYVR